MTTSRVPVSKTQGATESTQCQSWLGQEQLDGREEHTGKQNN